MRRWRKEEGERKGGGEEKKVRRRGVNRDCGKKNKGMEEIEGGRG